ncbi:MAG: aminoglycoside phosphotransferase family protein [Opitutaceae bacterium]|nr:aminoglycoside phosphotransferase family protein [Opitutaceae bacterium]
MTNPAHAPDLRAASAAFVIHGRYVAGAPHGSGHINDTYAVQFDQAGVRVRYLLQRINHRIFKDVPGLMENIRRVCEHSQTRVSSGSGPADSRRSLVLVPTRDGQACHRDDTGSWWRCFLFIEGARTHDVIESPAQAREGARAFGAFQALLADLPGKRLHETIPQFHHTRRRFDVLRAAIDADPRNRAARARAEIGFALGQERIVDVLLDLQARGEIPERVTHNDTKLNNVMIDDRTGEGLCVVDLDTVMPGLALYDFGDMVRSATNAAAEDDPDPARVQARLPVFAALVEGYLATAGAFLNAAERAHLVFSGRLITYEIGIRFLTDFLEGDVYFKTRHPEHNLDRARNQFALVHSLEAQQAVMESMVQRHPLP